MLWLWLLGVVTFLIIVLRRVLRRQKPLSAELFEKRVAIEHVRSGVAWVPEDGRLGWLNPALGEALQIRPEELMGREWYQLFAADEQERVREAYRKMLLTGKATLAAKARRADGTSAPCDVLLVAVYDHRTRFVGHHCITEDRTGKPAAANSVPTSYQHIG